MAETLSPILSHETEQRIAAILDALCDAERTLATAESCTGGLLASLFTDVPGCSHVFIAGYVAYAETAKTAMLGVPAELVAARGAVSPEVAVAMAEGALAAAPADYALATTGFAGKGTEPGDESGLVYLALARTGEPTLHRECHFGDIGRGDTRLRTITAAVGLLGDVVLG